MSKDHAVKVDTSALCHAPRLQLRGLIGNTPMIRIYYLYNGHVHSIFAKLESFNMTGSIKDRMAVHIIERSYQDGSLKKGDWIVEATSGNTGISLSAIGRALGHPVKIFMPDWMSQERVNLIRQFGAEIQLVSKEDGGFLGSIAMARDFAHQHGNVFLPSQFDNPYNCQAHYETTGPEIWNQLARQGLRPQAFIAGVGTGGTVMGVGRYLKDQDPQIRVHPLEPSNSPTLSTGYKTGHHRIQGISDEFIPSILKLDELDAIVEVDDGDTIIMAQQLACKLGLGLGISSGANFLGAIKIREQLPDDAVVCTVFSDSNKKYLSTDLLRNEPRKSNCETCLVELLHFEVCP